MDPQGEIASVGWGPVVPNLRYGGSGSLDVYSINYQDPPTGCLETLTGGFWALVVTRKHLGESPPSSAPLGVRLGQRKTRMSPFTAWNCSVASVQQA